MDSDVHYSQESDIIGTSDFEHIIDDLNQGASQFMPYRQDQFNVQEYMDINGLADPTQGNYISNGPTGPPDRMVLAIPSDLNSSTGNLLCTDKFRGPLDFDVSLFNTNRPGWVYSPKLEKVFIGVDKVLIFEFRVNTRNIAGLFIRAVLVYITPEDMNMPVNRCTLHKFKADPNNLAHADKDVCLCTDYNNSGHIITSDHLFAKYNYNPESGRHSVVVPLELPQVGSDSTTVAYQFGCKTSCIGGTNRKPTSIVFTLETEQGEVVGRNSIFVKVCSCPRRDKEREEKEVSPVTGNNKRRSSNQTDNDQPRLVKVIKLEQNSRNGTLEEPPDSPGLMTSLLELMKKNHEECIQQNERHHREIMEQNRVHYNGICRSVSELATVYRHCFLHNNGISQIRQ